MNYHDIYNIHNLLIKKYNSPINYKLNKKQIGSAINIDTMNYCTKKCYKIPYTIDNVSRIIAIGDVHGDFQLVLSSLYIANVISISTTKSDDDNIEVSYNDKKLSIKWIGNTTHVVQIGDQIDRCRPTNNECNSPYETVEDEDSDLKILYFFTELHELARKHGGMVISLLGNHELMNIKGNMTYVSYKGIYNFEGSVDYQLGLELRKKLFSLKEQKLAKYIACTRLAAVVINKILFIHAGLLPKLARDYNINDLNILLKKWLTNTLRYDKSADVPITQQGIKKLFLSKDSIFWTRVHGNLPTNLPNTDERCIRYVLPTYKLYDIKGMIIGHTPQIIYGETGINGTCDNSLWRIDDGMSKAFKKYNKKAGKEAQVLEILFERGEPIYSKLVGNFIEIS